jgi:hypothetical protein
VKGLGALPDETVIDGEVVALDQGWPAFIQSASGRTTPGQEFAALRQEMKSGALLGFGFVRRKTPSA